MLRSIVSRGGLLVLGLISVMWVSGCSTLPAASDSDADRIADVRDKCPGTQPGHPVNAQGCELFARTLQQVNFTAGSTALNSASRDSLDELILQLREHRQVVLAIDGHTDNRGSARDNLELSKKRVMSVVRYLVVKGIEARRLRPYGFGESRPRVSNATSTGREVNRRIEISVHSVSGA